MWNLFQIRDSERKPTSCSLLLCALYTTITVLAHSVVLFDTQVTLPMHHGNENVSSSAQNFYLSLAGMVSSIHENFQSFVFEHEFIQISK